MAVGAVNSNCERELHVVIGPQTRLLHIVGAANWNWESLQVVINAQARLPVCVQGATSYCDTSHASHESQPVSEVPKHGVVRYEPRLHR